MKFIIHSKSENGFWHNKIGWVYKASSATKFCCDTDKIDIMKQDVTLPLSRDNDAEWQVYHYSE